MPAPLNLKKLQEETFSLIRAGRPQKTLKIFSVDSDRIYPLRERIEIYRFAYRARFEEALIEDFILFQRKIGPRKFLRLVRSFIEKEGSKTFTLNALGFFFLKFLKKSNSPHYHWATLDWTIAEAVFWRHIHAPQIVVFPTQTWGVVRTPKGVFFRRLTKTESLILYGFKKRPNHPLEYLAQILQKEKTTPLKAKNAISCLVRDGFISGKMTPKR